MGRSRLTLYRTIACLSLVALGPSARADIFNLDISDDRFTLYTDPNSGLELKLGGLSGLIPAPFDRHGRTFLAITDRGPNIDFGASGKGFPVPEFSPSILTVRLRDDGTARIERVLPLRKPDGSPVSGIPSACSTSEDPVVDLNGVALPRDPDGLDVEGLTPGPFGTFWICEEYLPSVALVAPDGRVVLRLVPAGTLCGGERIPTFDVLPRVLTKRIANRGFEGITIAPNGKLYVTLQRPLANPSRAVSEASRNVRIVEIDPRRLLFGKAGAVRQLIYLTDTVSRSILLSDLFAIDADNMLVSERRTDKIYAVLLSSASDVSGLEDVDGNLLVPFQPDPTQPAKTTLEQLTETELGAIGVQTFAKTLVYSNLRAIDPALDKVEGICLSQGRLVVCPDNDFNVAGGDYATTPATLIFQDPPNLPKIITIPLPSSP